MDSKPSRAKSVLFFSHYFVPEGNAPASRVHALCKRWVREGWDVTVVTCAPNVPNGRVYDGYRNRLSQTEEVDGIRVVRVWTFITANEGVTLRVLSFLSYMLAATLRTNAKGRLAIITLSISKRSGGETWRDRREGEVGGRIRARTGCI